MSEPTVAALRSEDGQRWIVQIDTSADTGHVTVYINDGDPVFDQDPECHGHVCANCKGDPNDDWHDSLNCWRGGPRHA